MRHYYSDIYDGVKLSPMQYNESEIYRVMRNHENIQGAFFSKYEITQEQQVKWFEKYLKTENDYMFSIKINNNLMVGGCGIYNINGNIGEFGRIVISDQYKKEGIGYKATMSLLKIAKEKIGLNEIFLEVWKYNIAARSLYKKVGFIELIPEKRNEIISMKIELKN